MPREYHSTQTILQTTGPPGRDLGVSNAPRALSGTLPRPSQRLRCPPLRGLAAELPLSERKLFKLLGSPACLGHSWDSSKDFMRLDTFATEQQRRCTHGAVMLNCRSA